MVGHMSASVPPDKFPQLVQWLFPLLELQERAVMAGVWQSLMPAEVFGKARGLVRKAVGEDWEDLVRGCGGPVIAIPATNASVLIWKYRFLNRC